MLENFSFQYFFYVTDLVLAKKTLNRPACRIDIPCEKVIVQKCCCARIHCKNVTVVQQCCRKNLSS